MNIREGIRQALLANEAIADIVGQRITASFAPPTAGITLPWIVMTKIRGGEEGAHDGDQRLTHPLFQFTIGGDDKEKVDELQRLLVAMNCTNFDYVEGTSTYQLTFIHSDDRDALYDGSVRVSEASVDLEIWVET